MRQDSHIYISVAAAEVQEEVKPEEVSGLAPEFLEKPRFQTVDEGQTVTFMGSVEATPQPQVCIVCYV